MAWLGFRGTALLEVALYTESEEEILAARPGLGRDDFEILSEKLIHEAGRRSAFRNTTPINASGSVGNSPSSGACARSGTLRLQDRALRYASLSAIHFDLRIFEVEGAEPEPQTQLD